MDIVVKSFLLPNLSTFNWASRSFPIVSLCLAEAFYEQSMPKKFAQILRLGPVCQMSTLRTSFRHPFDVISSFVRVFAQRPLSSASHPAV